MPDLRSELLAIREEHGKLTPAIVVEAAAADDHPLHSRFEWDDRIAGHKYRLSQARQLIRVVREHYTDSQGHPEDVRFFHAVQRPEGSEYIPATEIVEDEFATRLLLQQMEREWRSLRKRYERFDQFRQIVLRDLTEPAA